MSEREIDLLERVPSDTHFASLESDPRFQQLLSKYEQRRTRPREALSRAYEQLAEQRSETARSPRQARPGRPDGVKRVQIRIRFWRQHVSKSGLTCFDGFLSLLDSWLDLIANYFIDHQTSAFVEGLNTKLKILKRRCYGLRNIGRLFQRLTLDLEGYRRFSPWRASTCSAVSGNS
jgi:transposase